MYHRAKALRTILRKKNTANFSTKLEIELKQLPWSASLASIRNIFEGLNVEVSSVKLLNDKSGNFIGDANIFLRNVTDSNRIIKHLNSLSINNKPLNATIVTKPCFKCNKPGHIAADCPQSKKQLLCFKCGESGHFANECGAPKEGENDIFIKPKLFDEPSSYNLNTSKIPNACDSCGETDHITAFCPKLVGEDFVSRLASAGKNKMNNSENFKNQIRAMNDSRSSLGKQKKTTIWDTDEPYSPVTSSNGGDVYPDLLHLSEDDAIRMIGARDTSDMDPSSYYNGNLNNLLNGGEFSDDWSHNNDNDAGGDITRGGDVDITSEVESQRRRKRGRKRGGRAIASGKHKLNDPSTSSNNKAYEENILANMNCHRCGKYGHVASLCEENVYEKCYKCGSKDHKAKDCIETGKVCFKCGGYNHYGRDCWNKNIKEPVPEVKVTCSICNTVGHRAQYCPSIGVKFVQIIGDKLEKNSDVSQNESVIDNNNSNKSTAFETIKKQSHMIVRKIEGRPKLSIDEKESVVNTSESDDDTNTNNNNNTITTTNDDTLALHAENNVNNQSNIEIPKVSCFRCGLQGHTVRECTAPKGSLKSDIGKCYKCGLTGHFAKNCHTFDRELEAMKSRWENMKKVNKQEKMARSPKSQSSSEKALQCYRCGSEDHLTATCPIPSVDPRTYEAPVKCFLCKEYGHLARDCVNTKSCHKCGYSGHFAEDCVKEFAPGEKRRTGCFHCGSLEHFSKSCDKVSCFTCGETGHFARDCMSKEKRPRSSKRNIGYRNSGNNDRNHSKRIQTKSQFKDFNTRKIDKNSNSNSSEARESSSQEGSSSNNRSSKDKLYILPAKKGSWGSSSILCSSTSSS